MKRRWGDPHLLLFQNDIRRIMYNFKVEDVLKYLEEEVN